VAIHGLWPVAHNPEQPAHRRAFLQALIRAVSDR
jgi:hypothetical protein